MAVLARACARAGAGADSGRRSRTVTACTKRGFRRPSVATRPRGGRVHAWSDKLGRVMPSERVRRRGESRRRPSADMNVVRILGWFGQVRADHLQTSASAHSGGGHLSSDAGSTAGCVAYGRTVLRLTTTAATGRRAGLPVAGSAALERPLEPLRPLRRLRPAPARAGRPRRRAATPCRCAPTAGRGRSRPKWPYAAVCR